MQLFDAIANTGFYYHEFRVSFVVDTFSLYSLFKLVCLFLLLLGGQLFLYEKTNQSFCIRKAPPLKNFATGCTRASWPNFRMRGCGVGRPNINRNDVEKSIYWQMKILCKFAKRWGNNNNAQAWNDQRTSIDIMVFRIRHIQHGHRAVRS
jgi:hypothetical protein